MLVVGRWLFGRADTAALSAALGTEVQHFATHRVVEMHRWERAVGGVVRRRFEYVGESGEVTAWLGDPDAAEVAAGLPATLYDRANVLVSESDVMRVAGSWSVDPTSLHGRPAPAPLRAAAVA